MSATNLSAILINSCEYLSGKTYFGILLKEPGFCNFWQCSQYQRHIFMLSIFWNFRQCLNHILVFSPRRQMHSRACLPPKDIFESIFWNFSDKEKGGKARPTIKRKQHQSINILWRPSFALSTWRNGGRKKPNFLLYITWITSTGGQK